MSQLIVVTGLPAAGKTTLARRLSAALRLPLISRDVVKEAIADAIAEPDALSAKSLGTASNDVMWALLDDFPTGAIIETWIDPVRGDNTEAIRRLNATGREIVEILCQCPGDLAAERYASRVRHSIHRVDDTVLARIREAADVMKPLGVGPALIVDTSKPAGIDDVVAWINSRSP